MQNFINWQIENPEIVGLVGLIINITLSYYGFWRKA